MTVLRPEIRTFLSHGTRTGKLGYVAADGRPLVAPIWFVLDGDDVLFTTARDSAKGRAIARGPRLVLCVDLEEPPYAYVQVQGEAEVSEHPDELVRSATAIGAPLHGGGPRGGVRPPQRGARRAAGTPARDEGRRRPGRLRLTDAAAGGPDADVSPQPGSIGEQ